MRRPDPQVTAPVYDGNVAAAKAGPRPASRPGVVSFQNGLHHPATLRAWLPGHTGSAYRRTDDVFG